MPLITHFILNKPAKPINLSLLFGVFLCFSLSQMSCVEHRQLVNFRQAPDSLVHRSLPLPMIPAHTIQVDDQLGINIYSLDPDAAAPLNLQASSVSSRPTPSGNISTTIPGESIGQGYLVDRDGNIDMPALGRIKVAGLTVQQLKDTIAQRALKFVNDPIINIRYLNFRFTVLGEVERPGTYVLSNESISILEALGVAGDISDYGNRENILVVRTEGDKQVFQPINLTTQDIFTSPYFYLHKNDIIYVEPMEAKVASLADPGTKVLPYVSVFVTFGTLIITVISLATR